MLFVLKRKFFLDTCVCKNVELLDSGNLMTLYGLNSCFCDIFSCACYEFNWYRTQLMFKPKFVYRFCDVWVIMLPQFELSLRGYEFSTLNLRFDVSNSERTEIWSFICLAFGLKFYTNVVRFLFCQLLFLILRLFISIICLGIINFFA